MIAQALFRPAQLKALVDIHAQDEGLPEGYLTAGVSCLIASPCITGACKVTARTCGACAACACSQGWFARLGLCATHSCLLLAECQPVQEWRTGMHFRLGLGFLPGVVAVGSALAACAPQSTATGALRFPRRIDHVWHGKSLRPGRVLEPVQLQDAHADLI